MINTDNDHAQLDMATKQRDRHHAAGSVSSEFENLAGFKEFALGGSWDPSHDRIHIAAIPYVMIPDQKIDWVKALKREVPVVVIYTQPHGAWAGEGKKTGLGQWVVVVWRKYNGNIFKPAAVFSTRKQVYTTRIKEFGTEPTERSIDEAVNQENLIGSTAMMKVTSLSSSRELKCRVDTGATISSIHCDRWKVNGDSVEFENKELSANVITLPLVTHQATRTSDGGTENRPVIELNVRINGKVLQGMQFNLNNRQHMEYPVLIGQNILQKGKFLIDPSMVSEEVIDDADDIDWDALMEEVNINVPDIEEDDVEVVTENIIDILRQSNLTFADIFSQVQNTAEADK